jgi:hypothetical protein
MVDMAELASELWTSLGFGGSPPKKCATRIVCAVLGFNYDQRIKECEAERTDESKRKYYESEDCRRDRGPRIWGSPDMALWANLSRELCTAILISTKTKTSVLELCPILTDLQTIVVGYLVCNNLDRIANFMLAVDTCLVDYVDIQEFFPTSDNSALQWASRESINEALAINLLLQNTVTFKNQEEIETALVSLFRNNFMGHARYIPTILSRALESIGRSVIPHFSSCNLVF